MRTIVLMPGMDGSGELFAPLVSVIGAQTHLQIMRYPPKIALGYAELANFAAMQLPNLPCTLVAESFSGPIAIELAARFPERVTHVVLSCSFVRNPLPWLAFSAPLIDFLPVNIEPKWWLTQQLFNGQANDEQLVCLKRASQDLSSEVIRARLKAVLNVDVRTRAKQTAQPMLYLRAKEDRIVPIGAASEVGLARPDARIVSLAGPHCLLQVEPQAAWQQIRTLLAG